MQLNDILEAYNIKDISKKTHISEDNLKNLLDMKFDTLNKAKVMGFLSILEREYRADLTDFKNIAHDYYRQNKEVLHYAMESTVKEDKGSNKSKIFIVIILLIFAIASWYFFTQFDKKHLSSFNFFGDDLTIENNITKNDDTNQTEPKVDIIEDTPKVDIITILDTPLVDINSSQVEIDKNSEENKSIDTNSSQIVEKDETNITIVEVEKIEPKEIEEPKVEETKIVTIEPSKRLWFGIRDIKTKKRDQFSIAKPYKLDVTNQSWLLATSSASFYLIVDGKKSYYKGGKSQYLKITKDSVEVLNKKEYVKQGGWKQW